MTESRILVAGGLWPPALLLACAEPNASKPYDDAVDVAARPGQTLRGSAYQPVAR